MNKLTEGGKGLKLITSSEIKSYLVEVEAS